MTNSIISIRFHIIWFSKNKTNELSGESRLPFIGKEWTWSFVPK